MSFWNSVNPLKRILMVVALFFPRNKNLFVFGSETGPFADNSKYMFLELSDNTSKKAVWICDDESIVGKLNEEGYNAYLENTLKAKICSLRAGYAIVDHYIADLPSWYILGADIVNLWHGFPYKEMGDKAPENWKEKLIKKFRKTFYSEDHFLTTSRKYSHILSGESEGPRIYSGYPRNDIFTSDIPGSEIGTKVPEEEFILYLPTFRDSSKFEENANLQAIDNILVGLDKKMILKPHPRTKVDHSFNNIDVIGNQIDIYPLLKQSSALITDYSSVMFDYMYTGNSIILYQFDKEEYEKIRGLNKEVEHLIPGKEVTAVEDLKEAIENIDKIDTDYEDKINEVFECREREGMQFKKILNQIS